MAESEVESILREIRERVVAQQRTARKITPLRSANGDNRGGVTVTREQVSPDDQLFAENLALLNSYLTTTTRAWDRLPPLVSNRSGVSARLELWLKRQLKRMTHWFTWEQVNFNAAVNQALRDLLPLLSAQENELRSLHAEIVELEEKQIAQLSDLRASIKAELDTERTEQQAQQTRFDTQRREAEIRLERLTNELRERDAILRDEQRVCFKQLALETSEAAVLTDRAHRKTEALLQELERRVAELEKEKKS